jgi:thiol-disulfide isomerase/thioredoxin
MKNHLFTCIIVMLCLIAGKSIANPPRAEQKDQITLVFRNIPPDNTTFRTKSGGFMKYPFDVKYTEDNLVEQLLSFDESLEADTIRIITGREHFEVHLAYKIVGFQEARYLFRKGDTVIIDYKERIPYATVTNRSIPGFDVNFDVLKNKIFSVDGIPANSKYNQAIMYVDMSRIDQLRAQINQFRDSLLPIVKYQIAREPAIMDSLYDIGLLSKTEYDYRKQILLSQVYGMHKQGIKSEDHSIKTLLNDTISYYNANDSLLYYGYYQNFLSNSVNQRLRQIPWIVTTNSRNPNYCAEFDSIARFDFISPIAQKFLLIRRLKNIFEDGSITEIETYQKKFLDLTGDSQLISQFLKNSDVDLNTKNELLLKDLAGDRKDFESLLREHQGKVVYIDFWASWCAPCRASMPKAVELRQEYSGKEVVFIYLAFNDTEKNWKEAIPRLEMETNCENYFIVNSRSSKFIEEMNVRSIPRYMLFNKKGELAQQNAPGPEGEQIRELLNNYLSE